MVRWDSSNTSSTAAALSGPVTISFELAGRALSHSLCGVDEAALAERRKDKAEREARHAETAAALAQAKQRGKKMLKESYYDLLQIPEDADEEQIVAAHRRLVMLHHPDKFMSEPEATRELNNKVFERFTSAHDTLIDPKLRKDYDSTLPFDDSYPTKQPKTDEAFFEVFNEVFERNSKWSEITPVPKIGNNDTPMEEVEAFYDFWFSFKSWRQFPQGDEHDLTEADCREDRRWMEQQNKKMRTKLKKKENERMRLMIENAERWDPRLLRVKNAAENKKKAEKEAKELAKKQAKEAKEKAEKEAKEKEEADKIAAKEAKKNQAQTRKKNRQRLRKFLGLTAGDDMPEHFDTICVERPPEETAEFLAKMEATAEEADRKALFDAHVKTFA